MSNSLSPEMLSEIYYQDSGDPFLTLLTINHESFTTPMRLVNNIDDVTSGGEVFTGFPFTLALPVDDGESQRTVTITFDNVSLELMTSLRSITTPLTFGIQMILASMPNEIQVSLFDLKLDTISYNAQTVRANLTLDSFLNSSMNSETYGPTNFPGLF
jgi:hypothetical protein|tara:strand:- start:7568 stop:8041 length:474 start_codon:yes stop_codon:yes gene_type:complete